MPIPEHNWETLLSSGMLFNGGFIDGTTPLDALTLNQILNGILNNKGAIETLGTSNNNSIESESANRSNADKAINRMVWGTDSTPTTGKTVAQLITDIGNLIRSEAANRSNADKAINQMVWGADSPPTGEDTILELIDEINNSIDEVNNSIESESTERSNAISELITNIDENLSGLEDRLKDKVFSSLEEAQQYATTDENAYVGQDIKVIDADGKVTLYAIKNELGELSVITSDGGDSGNVIYLNTREHIGRRVELQDVFPIQTDDSYIKVVAKNKLTYIINSTSVNGVSIELNSNFIKVTGKATSQISQTYIDIGEVDIDVQGKYTLSTNNLGVGREPSATKKCYPVYILYDNLGGIVRDVTPLEESVTIDTRELNCKKIKIQLMLSTSAGATFEGTNSQEFKLQVEYGDTATDWGVPGSQLDVSNKQVTIYGRNLFTASNVFDDKLVNVGELNNVSTEYPIILNDDDEPVGNIERPGMYYFKGEMTNDYYIKYSNTSNSFVRNIKTPFITGDKFTLIYNVISINDNTATIKDVQVVYGHTNYSVYEPYTASQVVSNSLGKCDATQLKYPYAFIAMDNSVSNDYTLQLKYDPALSRDWTEKCLDDLSKRVTAIEENGVDIDLDNYYTIDEVDAALEDLASSSDNIVVSETEPTVAEETIWLQPILTDQDYIVEQHIDKDNNVYYEKWNSGIVKYYATNNEQISSSDGNKKQNYLNIDINICNSIISHNITVCDIDTTSESVYVVQNSVSSDSSNLSATYTMFFTQRDATFTTHHAIIGTWK